jgi:GTPase Era involved in 16S rRNA processing
MTEVPRTTYRSGLRLLRRAPQRGQVDADERARRAEDRDHLQQAADHAGIIRGIVNRPDGQLVLIDTPGLHRPAHPAGERLNDLVYETWSEVDVIGVCLPCNQRIGPGDEFLLKEIAKLPRRPKLVALATKTDLVSRSGSASTWSRSPRWRRSWACTGRPIVPVSALTDDQVDIVVGDSCSAAAAGPVLYSPTARSPTSRSRPGSPS